MTENEYQSLMPTKENVCTLEELLRKPESAFPDGSDKSAILEHHASCYLECKKCNSRKARERLNLENDKNHWHLYAELVDRNDEYNIFNILLGRLN